ncbi:hypothetical protein KM1_035360 [Entamoeba histolytica HM-3:IMSS]|uniref:Cdc37 Hsp90 binding domain-containing protein n=5 Tax=Entamoeba histolytica TaxID=5759 RepID=C4LTU0_ENTH1|nr:hypothetical protein EHI_050700 [Entamoeba histolytica HM-1:IMSS]EMD47583.1 Hypothetical protein EHI5A_029330 [Entamoeba histolytica KU27]EMS11838.1 hypothetical protein KM1_035360 [Entamoeba histolytica HM-3:IMSS]ENY64007.1 hypothetical protein EHI7A_015830 [Entamoeba histolytica HM-1:IMSS-A]GAT91999.1 hypothetical protein CL6EHI_050700 [Entamoeba histolytica]EAL51206.1 hypothetical protein EHI_050700 [Entamoeba histolytica HM-1:IMSS]|eukprot:XP_656590.1 hypothetical protein EHI_050700 [Entamoeba histolytica HM-1:IMSS]
MNPNSKIPPELVDDVANFLDQETYEDCKVYLTKHYKLIDRKVADGLFEDSLLTFVQYPPQFGARMVRCSQILTYLCDIRDATHGQQDITLFFYRLLGPDPSFKKGFEDHCKMLCEKMIQSAARIKKSMEEEEKAKATKGKEEEKEKEQQN